MSSKSQLRTLKGALAVAALLFLCVATPPIASAQDQDPDSAVDGPDPTAPAEPYAAPTGLGLAVAQALPGMYPAYILEDFTGDTYMWDLEFDDQGWIWGGSPSTDEVIAFDVLGNEVKRWGVAGSEVGQLNAPTGVDWADGRIYVADARNDRVQAFNADGIFQQAFGVGSGSGAGELDMPCDVVTVGSRVFVADSDNDRVQEFTTAGGFVNEFGEAGSGNGQLFYPCYASSIKHVNGELYVNDLFNDRIAVFSLDGDWNRNIPLGADSDAWKFDVDNDGTIWTADSSDEAIRKYTPLGQLLGDFGANGAGLGLFSNLRSVLVDPSGTSVWAGSSAFVGQTGSLQVFTTLTCGNMPLTVVGSPMPDVLTLDGADDVVHGSGGNDVINAGEGSNLVCGGSGTDTITGGASRDFIWGGDDGDTINGGFGIDYLRGEGGNDTLDGQGGSDRLFGGSGNDLMFGDSGADRMYGGSGHDDMRGMGGQDFMWGEAGNDVMQGNFQTDNMWGGPGNDQMFGAGGKDSLFGEGGNDTMTGGNNTDYLNGGAGVDSANGGRGRDRPLTEPTVRASNGQFFDGSGCIAETIVNCQAP